MSSEDNKILVRHFFDEVWNEGKTKEVRSIVSNDWLPFDPALDYIRPRSGTQGITTFVEIYRAAFPDLEFSVKEIIAEENMVVTHFEAQGTHSGEEVRVSFLGHGNFTMQPTGSKVKEKGVSINHITTSAKSAGPVRQIKSNSWYWREIGLLQALAVLQMKKRSHE